MRSRQDLERGLGRPVNDETGLETGAGAGRLLLIRGTVPENL
jgi:hypothetical protein